MLKNGTIPIYTGRMVTLRYANGCQFGLLYSLPPRNNIFSYYDYFLVRPKENSGLLNVRGLRHVLSSFSPCRNITDSSRPQLYRLFIIDCKHTHTHILMVVIFFESQRYTTDFSPLVLERWTVISGVIP